MQREGKVGHTVPRLARRRHWSPTPTEHQHSLWGELALHWTGRNGGGRQALITVALDKQRARGLRGCLTKFGVLHFAAIFTCIAVNKCDCSGEHTRPLWGRAWLRPLLSAIHPPAHAQHTVRCWETNSRRGAWAVNNVDAGGALINLSVRYVHTYSLPMTSNPLAPKS